MHVPSVNKYMYVLKLLKYTCKSDVKWEENASSLVGVLFDADRNGKAQRLRYCCYG